MKSPKLCAITFAALLVASALRAQDPVSRPALADDTRTILRGELTFDGTTLNRSLVFNPVWLSGRDDRAWLALEDDAAPEKGPPSVDVGFRERWLMKSVRERFQGVTTAETLRKVTIRSDGTSKTVTGERGIEVRGSPEALTQVRDFFDRFAAGSKKTVTVEVRVIAVGPKLPELTSVAVAATSRDLEARLKELVAEGAGQPIYSPATKLFANQTAKMAIVEQVAYIKDFDVQLVGGTKIADPVVDVIEDGFQMELTPVLDPDGGALIVSGSIGFSHLTRPIREHRVRIGDTDVTVQLPEVVTRRWNGEVKLEQGQNAIRISGLTYSAPGRERMQSVEVWCLVTLDDGASTPPAGQIVDRDEKNGNVFVKFPREYVPDDPWNKAPKEVGVYRGTEKIGTARLAGGWMLGADPVAEQAVVAIYHLDWGTPADGDSVR